MFEKETMFKKNSRLESGYVGLKDVSTLLKLSSLHFRLSDSILLLYLLQITIHEGWENINLINLTPTQQCSLPNYLINYFLLLSVKTMVFVLISRIWNNGFSILLHAHLSCGCWSEGAAHYLLCWLRVFAS